MQYKVKDVTQVIEGFAPLSIQEKWDNSGLCVGSPEASVSSVLFGLDCTPELVDEAIECGADMIVTHHPLIFSGLKKISPDDQVGAAVIKAIKAGISIYAAHTSADKVIAGVSGAMAAKLGLKDVRILDEDGEGTGLGVVGELPEALSAEEAVKFVKENWVFQKPCDVSFIVQGVKSSFKLAFIAFYKYGLPHLFKGKGLKCF